MLDFLLPYAYLWPVLTFLLLLVFVCLLFLNAFLSLVCLAFYSLVPQEKIDFLIQSCLHIIRHKFSFYFEKTEDNIRDTFQIHLEKELPDKGILIWHPHGLMTITSAIHNAFGITNNNYVPTKIVSLDLYHKIPIIKDLMRNLNVVSSNYDTIKSTLQNESISIMLGGVKELLNTNDDTMMFVIKDRSGIFRLALETGSSLVPVITYGENELFSPIRNEFLDSINAALYSMLRIAIPVPTWNSLKNWVNLYKGPLMPVHTHVGTPIQVTKVNRPTKKDIDTLRDTYISELTKLFERTNRGNYKLQII
jgi:hypothetical protein